RKKMLLIASHALRCDAAELRIRDGSIYAADGRTISFKDISSLAYKRISLLPEDMEPGLKEIAYYRNPAAKPPRKEDFTVQLTHANSIHVATVEADVVTGQIKFLNYVIVHDCGNVINPAIVAGMTIGSTVHGIGATFLEEFVYDDNGQLLSSTFMDYLKPL